MKHYTLGILLAKIEYWSHRYDFSFQFWGAGRNNVFIYRKGVELFSAGDYETIEDLFKEVLEWCEAAYPRYEYPKGLVVTNPQP